MKTSKTKCPKILYLSRGRGFSHAMYDLLILKELKKINDDVVVHVATYDKGYTYFIENGFKPFNLGLKQDEELSLKSGFRIWSIIRKFRPDLVVTDEVFIALHVTKGLRIPSILITHWFFETFGGEHPIIPAIKKANHVIFVDTPEFHNIPLDYNVNITFVGPVIREFEYSLKDKNKVRKELGIKKKNKVILVTPGGRYEERSELLEVSIEAFKELNIKDKSLILLTGDLYEEYWERFADDNSIIVKDFEWKIEKLMVASDLAICKGTFMTTWELAYLGIPSISVPDMNNPVDHFHVHRMTEHNFTLKIGPKDFDRDILLLNINKILESKCNNTDIAKSCREIMYGRGQKEAAEEINYFVSRISK